MRGDEDGRLIVRNSLLAASDLGLSRVDRIVEDYPIYQLDVPEIGTIEWWYGISVQVGGGPWFNVRVADEKSETDGWKQLQ